MDGRGRLALQRARRRLLTRWTAGIDHGGLPPAAARRASRYARRADRHRLRLHDGAPDADVRGSRAGDRAGE